MGVDLVGPVERIAEFLGYSGGGELGSDVFHPYIDHIGPQTMLLADNSIMAVARLPGVPFSVLMNAERNSLKRRETAFLNGVADENTEVHIHLVKHDATLPPLTVRPPSAAYARVLLADYHASIEDDLAVVDWFVTLRCKPRRNPFASVTDKARDFATKVGLARDRSGLDPELEVQLEDAMRLCLTTLAPFGPTRLGVRFEDPGDDGEPLAYSEIAEFLYLLKTTQFSPQPLTDVCGFLGAGVAAVDVTAVSGTSMLRIDHAAGGGRGSQSWVAMLGMVTMPRRLSVARLDDLLAINGRFVMTVALRYQSRAESKDSLALLHRRLSASNPRGSSDTDDLEAAIDDVASGRAESGIARWSLALHGATPGDVDRLVSVARTVYANAGAKIAPERAARLNAYLAQLPAAPPRTWVRPARCTTRQITVLASLSGYARGPAKARWGHHLLRLMTTGGTAYDHDLFVGDVGHSVLVAPNGGGKTVFLGTNICALDEIVGASGGTQVILDVDESNHNTIRMLRGRYSTISVGHSGLAPLRGLPDTPRVRALLRDLVAGLVQTDGAPPPTKVERDGIRQGIDFVMGSLEPCDRTLTTVREYMGFEPNGAGERLEPWCGDNELGWVFDGPKHVIDFNTRLVGVDLTGIMEDKRVMPPVALLLLWMASDVMDGRRVVIWCEEAPAYMPGPAFARPFKGIALRARKRNASFNAIAQQPGDLLSNEAGQALVRQARQIVMFRNDKADEADYRKGMGLTAAEFASVSEGMFALPFHAVQIKRQDGQSGVLRFDLSSLPQHLDVLSGTPPKVRLLRDCLDHNEDPLQALAEFRSRIHETAA